MPDVVVFRPEASLLYFNVEHVREKLEEILEARGDGVRLAVFFLGSVPAVDLAGADFLEELHHDLAARGITLRLAETRGQVRDVLLRAGLDRLGLPVVPHQPVVAVVAEWRGGTPVDSSR
jgi:SulP family sulfate permease